MRTLPRLHPDIARKRRAELSKTIEKASQGLKDLKKQCSHDGSLSYSPDPSGNNDSSYDCSACGACFSRWPDDVPRSTN